jgi:hypothetical protein
MSSETVAAIKDIDERIEGMWQAVAIFTRNRDAHGVMDMGAELQSLQRARVELMKLAAVSAA